MIFNPAYYLALTKKLPILKLPKEKHEIITELVKKNLSAKNEETYLQIDKIINSFFEIVR